MKENNKSLVTTIIVIAVFVVGYVVWVSYANKKVREVVDTSLARVEERMESNGNDVTITYDDVQVHSFSLRPRASVYKLHMKIVNPRGKREVHVMMPEVVYIPKTFNMHSYRLEVLDSVTVLANSPKEGQESTLVDFSSVPAIDVNEKSDGSVEYTADVPEHITLTDADDTSDTAAAEKTDINFASKPQVAWAVSGTGINLDQKALFPETTITHGGDVLAKADGLTLETKHTAGEGVVHTYDTMVKLDNLNFASDDLQVLNPVSMVNDMSYTGPVVPKGAEPSDEPMHFKLNNIAVMSGLISLFATGDVTLDPKKEKMPYGNVSLRFNDVEKFLDYAKNQRPKAEAYLQKVRGALEQLSGTKITEDDTVTIDLTREPQGRLYIGKLSLEESLGLFIEMAMALPDLSPPEGDSTDMDDADDAEMQGDVDEDDAVDVPAAAEDEAMPEEKTVDKPMQNPITPKKGDDVVVGSENGAGAAAEVTDKAEAEAVATEAASKAVEGEAKAPADAE